MAVGIHAGHEINHVLLGTKGDVFVQCRNGEEATSVGGTGDDGGQAGLGMQERVVRGFCGVAFFVGEGVGEGVGVGRTGIGVGIGSGGSAVAWSA